MAKQKYGIKVSAKHAEIYLQWEVAGRKEIPDAGHVDLLPVLAEIFGMGHATKTEAEALATRVNCVVNFELGEKTSSRPQVVATVVKLEA